MIDPPRGTAASIAGDEPDRAADVDALAAAARLPVRSRGTIALLDQNCTSCMLCARECPDWCIHIEAHVEESPPERPGGRPRRREVLDSFDIDFSLCMYCGICIEVCPFDALFWTPEHHTEGSERAELRHDRAQLGAAMTAVPDPPSGAEPTAGPGADTGERASH